MTLQEYLEKEQISLRQFCLKHKLKYSTLCCYLNGIRQPRLDIALMIEAVSNGQITLESWKRPEAK